jgi:hypothetical protein
LYNDINLVTFYLKFYNREEREGFSRRLAKYHVVVEVF